MSLFDAKFYNFYVHLVPDSPDSLTRFAFEAKRFGYSGIAVLGLEIDTLNKSNIPEDFSIFGANEISGKPSRFREEIKKYTESKNILIIRGVNEETNRTAVEIAGLDILLQPTKFNHILARAAGDNSVAIGFNMGLIIRMRGEARIREFRTMRTNLKYARKYELQMVLTGDTYSHYDLRSPREMAAIADLFGMTAKEAVDAMSAVPLDILRRKNPNYIREGIEII